MTTLAASASGCAIGIPLAMAGLDVALELAAAEQAAKELAARREHLDSVIGDQSGPLSAPQIQDLRFFAYPLNASARQGKEPFLICIVPEATDGKAVTWQMRDASLDPDRIVLTLPDKTTVKPSGYALAGRCPYPELRRYAYVSALLTFREIDFTQPLVWRQDMKGNVTELVLKFDVPAPSPDKRYSLELGSLTLNYQAPQVVPKINFARYHGALLRASTEGHRTRDREAYQALYFPPRQSPPVATSSGVH